MSVEHLVLGFCLGSVVTLWVRVRFLERAFLNTSRLSEALLCMMCGVSTLDEALDRLKRQGRE